DVVDGAAQGCGRFGVKELVGGSIGVSYHIELGRGAAVIVGRMAIALVWRGGCTRDRDRADHASLLMARHRTDKGQALGGNIDFARDGFTRLGYNRCAIWEGNIVGQNAFVDQFDRVTTSLSDLKRARPKTHLKRV